MSLEERFWSKVTKTSGCWLWTGAKHNLGYGVLGKTGKGSGNIRATHVSWFLHTGYWTKQWMLHKCDNPACVNPNHLFEGLAKDNHDDMRLKGRGSNPPIRKELSNNKCKLSNADILKIREEAKKNLPSRRTGRIEFWTNIAKQFRITHRYAQRLCSQNSKEQLRRVE